MAALAGAAAPALLAITAAAGSLTAQVGLVGFGPLDPVSGFPNYYTDANGLRLGLCQNAALCTFVLPNPAAAPSIPNNFPVEQFYWGATGDMTGTTARMLYISALEASFAGGVVAAGQQMTFTRLRLRCSGLVDGGVYTITHPYGSTTQTAVGGVINITEDIGLVPGAFGDVLTGNVGPFLTPLGFTSRVPGTFISDNATLVNVQGSPLAQNFLRISGPSAGTLFPLFAVNASTAQLNQFTLQGRITSTTGVAVAKGHIAKTPIETAVNVWATALSGMSLQATVAGSLPASMTEIGTTGTFFGRVVLGPLAATPTSCTVSNISDIPPSVSTLGTLGDLVTVPSAIFTLGRDLVVTAHTSDVVANPALTATGLGFLPKVLVSTGSGNASAAVGLPPGSPPPDSVTVTSADGGTITVPVAVVPPPVLANAGPDQTALAGALVNLNGTASSGPITTFAWVHNAGTAITLVGADTATPSFTAPSLPTPLDITFSLTVSDAAGDVSTDTAIVHVLAAGGVADVVSIAAGPRYIVNKNNWRINGTASQHRGQTITVFLGAAGNTTRQIGTAVVGATGAWSLQTPQGAGPAPTAADSTIWARSALGGDSTPVTFTRN